MGLFDPQDFPEEAGSSADGASHISHGYISERQLEGIARDVKGMKGLGPMPLLNIAGFTRVPFTSRPGDTFVIELPNGRLVTEEHPENLAPGGEFTFLIDRDWLEAPPIVQPPTTPMPPPMPPPTGPVLQSEAELYDASLVLAMEVSMEEL